MKHLLLKIICILVLPLTLFANVENDNEADHEKLRELKKIYEKAVNNNDLEVLRPYLHDDFSIVTFTDREFVDFEAFKKQWNITREKMLKGGSYSVELVPDRSIIFGDIAIAKGNSKNILVTGDGEKHEFTARWTAVCKKVNGEWKVLRGHNSLDPFGNPILNSHLKKLYINTIIGCVVSGLILGWLSAFLFVRFRKR